MGRGRYSKKKKLSSDKLLTPAFFYKANWKMSEDEYSEVKKREKNLTKSKNEVIDKAKEVLGYDYTQKLACPPSLKITDINLPIGPNKQKCPIILSSAIVNKMLDMPKIYLGNKPQTVLTNWDKKYTENFQLYGGYDEDLGPILFYYVETEKEEKHKSHYSISLYALINGADSFEIFRYDSKYGHHPQRFNQDGKTTKEKYLLNGPHMHMYDENFTAIFPDSYCHYDVKQLAKNHDKISNQSLYLKSLYNLDPCKKYFIPEDVKIATYLKRAFLPEEHKEKEQNNGRNL